MPIKGFIHKVFFQSHTSGTIIQTALCYLEAIFTKVPELVEKEKVGEGIQSEPALWGGRMLIFYS
jgi:hypothetical protein